MKVLRWGYVLPRLVVVTALVLTVRFGLDPLLKWALVTGGEAAVGAKVDVAELTTSLWDGELVIRDLAVANPHKPMRNLFQIHEAHLQVDVTALTHDRVVVRDGTVTGLVLDGERTTSGELEAIPEIDSAESSTLDPWLARAGAQGAEWLDGLSDRLSADFTAELESLKLAKELEERWPAQYAQLKSDVKSLEEQGRALQATIKDLQKNPLRNIEGLQQLQGQLTTAQQQLATVRGQLEALPRQAEADRQAILTARQRDEQFLHEQLKFDALSRERLTQTLLGDEAATSLKSALEWVRWGRAQVPTGPAKPVQSRGTNVIFASPQPQFLVERLRMETELSLSGKPLALVGMLTNATNEPRLCPEPLRLDLQGEGLTVQLTLDHRRAVPEERLEIVCEQLALPNRRLGKSEKLALEVAPGAGSLHAKVLLIGEELSGQIHFQQSSTKITASAGTEKRQQLATLVNQALAGINYVEANVALSGTLDKPKFDLESNLGPELAAGINAAVQDWLAQRTASLLAEANQKVDAQLAKLGEARAKAERELMAQLGQHQELFGQLAAAFGGANLPIPQLSQKFDFGALRK